ncbi:hypothetical protein ACFQU2_00015 [Siccirubricoccus deserti]
MPPDTELASPAISAPWPLRDEVAFAGIGTTRYGNFPKPTATAWAARR